MRVYHISILALLLSIALGLYGCAPLQVDGGGTLPSTSGNAADKANFGLYGDNCTPGTITGTFNYHDRKAPGWPAGGVKLNGTVYEVAKCSEWANSPSNAWLACGICNLQFCECEGWPENWLTCALEFLADPTNYCQDVTIPDNLYGVSFQYTSTNPRYRGIGAGIACITDNGQGSKAIGKDNLVLIIGTGQYEGYINQGTVQGNISTQLCCHDLCLTGFPPDPACDSCVTEVCAVDSECCTTSWDSVCVSEAIDICGLACAD